MLYLQKTMGNLVPNFSDQMGNKEESERGSMWPVWVFDQYSIQHCRLVKMCSG